MQHYHYTNINHGHGITDPGHYHAYNIATNSGGAYAAPGDMGFYYENYAGITDTKTTGISVNGTGDLQKFSSGSLANNQWDGRTQTDSNNSNANENRPQNFTVKIWKRIA